MDSFLKSPVVIDNVPLFWLRAAASWKSASVAKKNDHSSSPPCSHQSLYSVGRPKYQVVIPNTANQLETYIGEELNTSKRGLYKLKHPLSHGVIDHWDDMELLWKHAFSLLKIAPNECPVLLTEANMNPTKHKRKMLEIFF